MKGNFKLAHKYLKYFFCARHYNGHGIHSPFVFDFVQNVLFNSEKDKSFNPIQAYLKSLYKNRQIIEIKDQGAGSLHFNSRKRRIKDIAKTSSTKPKYGKLLSQIIAYYKPENIIELGTSLGIGTDYMSLKMPGTSNLYTIEADENLYSIAKQHFESMNTKNIVPICGNFEQKLPELLSNIETIDLVYFDGNHRKNPTIEYFENCLEKINNQTIFIFDDIHWSSEMDEAWEYIKAHPATRVCIDLFQIGIVFFRKELSCENYTIRF